VLVLVVLVLEFGTSERTFEDEDENEDEYDWLNEGDVT